MKLNTKALAITVGLLWGGSVFLVAAINRFYRGYGVDFLNDMSSLYPGYHVAGLRMAMVGGLYGLVDGLVCGALIAWLYNTVSSKFASA